MPERSRLRTAALLARRPGLAVLEESLLTNEHLRPVVVVTHRRLPASEDPERGERTEYARFVELCREHQLPLLAVDDPAEARDLPFLVQYQPLDLLCSLSWRYILSPAGLARAKIAVNLHRGKLPEYAGAEPVFRMIEHGHTEAVVTAHVMTDEVDAGETLAVATLPFERPEGLDPRVLAEQVKDRLIPLYPRLLDEAVDAVLARA